MFKRERQLVRGGHKGEELIWGQSTGEGVKILGRFLLHRGMSAPSGRHPACTRLHLGPESVLLSDQVRDLESGFNLWSGFEDQGSTCHWRFSLGCESRLNLWMKIEPRIE